MQGKNQFKYIGLQTKNSGVQSSSFSLLLTAGRGVSIVDEIIIALLSCGTVYYVI